MSGSVSVAEWFIGAKSPRELRWKVLLGCICFVAAGCVLWAVAVGTADCGDFWWSGGTAEKVAELLWMTISSARLGLRRTRDSRGGHRHGGGLASDVWGQGPRKPKT